ncbi:serine hydrolase domain-containing protein [Sphingosinicella soli]|uniref:CubicO group peptidase (Beta-lactamase class C family) n=1 Tax=Sphingosinicella soli TaxID=333708 RepID=A0A7W7B1A5_9SPHN|nr:serine hydrolase domain-containing protein [Sphingosinicella soli]MBB4631140.1 CubicO group peptidase (beta-lactamase class C family) [Sphingosinicella soli]
MKLPIAILSLAIVSSPAQAVDVEAVRKLIADPRAASAPGCVAGAFKAGKTLFVTAAGMADVENARPLDGDTLIYAASVSKQFTVLAAATLAVQGKMGLQDDIRKYLPELPQYEVPVTAEMLIHHTSGIRDWLALSSWAGASDFSQAKKADVLSLLFRQQGTNFTPGTDFTYSNGGYLLLAEIIERVSGMPFSTYVTKTVLEPLGMKNSMFMNGAGPTKGKIAHGYKPKGDTFEIRDTYPTISGSGGLMVTINDLAKFDHDLEVGHKVWTPQVKAIMLAPGTFTNGEPALRKPSKQAYAGGLMVGERRGQYFVQHGGGAEAFRNQYARLPERRLGVAVFCNRSDWDPSERADAVIELVEGAILTDENKPLNGRYYSDELQATYDVSIDGKELTAAVTSPYAKAGKSETFERSSDGTFRANGTILTFLPDGGFTLGTERVRAIPFKKVTGN